MKCIVSGGTGFIGSRLVDALLKDGHYVAIWSRKPARETRTAVETFRWDPLEGEPQEESLNGFDIVVHLAGETGAQRWNAEAKRKIRDSRVLGTRRLVSAISKVKHKPSALICSSAVGYYGSHYGSSDDEVLTETSPPGSGFLAEVCTAWEKEADAAASLGLRVVKLRTGVVLGRAGGALAKMLPAFQAFVGGALGSGRQWMPWIHVDDLVDMCRFAIDGSFSAALNATAPNPVTNSQFTSALAKVLHRPAFLTVPAFALRALFGEMAQMLLEGQRAVPAAAKDLGFSWKYPGLEEALHNLLD
jgi:uncharacterized protein (TIGR01777 family)